MDPKLKALRIRITLVFLTCMAIATLVISRATWVQVRGDPRLASIGERQFRSKMLVVPRRGSIVDRNGEVLAMSVETRSLAVNPSKIENRKTVARVLEKALGLKADLIHSRLKGGREFAWIKRHLTESELQQLRRWHFIEPGDDLPAGFWWVKESQRAYPQGALAQSVVGTVNVDSVGLEGIELWKNENLKGQSPSIPSIRDARGMAALFDSSAASGIKKGDPVKLTLDVPLQFAVEKELKATVERTQSQAGVAVVMNAVTGEILAMANHQAHAGAGKQRNRFVTDGWEPGSTLKPLLLATALANGWKLGDRVWGERGKFRIGGRTISEAETHETFEWLSLKEMVRVSSNIGAAKLALRLGADRYGRGLTKLGFGTKTQLGFPGESSGRVPPRKAWTPLTLANIGFGQGILVTPIQLVRAYAAIVNGGWLVRPILIHSETSPPHRIFNSQVADKTLESLEAVVGPGGTGVHAAIDGFRVAGKTGTAQKVDPTTGRYSQSKYVASFVGTVLGIEQKWVIFAALDEPRGAYYGAEVAAPLFKTITQTTLNRYNIAPDQKLLLAMTKAAPEAGISDRLQWSLSKVAPAQGALRVAAEDPKSWVMPDLRGLTARELIRNLHGHLFDLRVFGDGGLVLGQLPEPGKKIREGDPIRITLARDLD